MNRKTQLDNFDRELRGEATPVEEELINLSKETKQLITSKGQLLNVVNSLQIDEMGIEEKMIYVLGMMSLGFEESNSLDALEVSKVDLRFWRQIPKHEAMLKKARARGDLIIEERVLTGVENDPRLALSLKQNREKERNRKEDKVIEKEKSILDLIDQGLKDRGQVVEEGEIINPLLK